jgi:hypothetical protein
MKPKKQGGSWGGGGAEGKKFDGWRNSAEAAPNSVNAP